MKKNYLLLLLLITTVWSYGQTPVITAIVDGTCTSGTPKMIEIYAQGSVDFNNYSLQKQSNGHGWSSTLSLSSLGTVTDSYVYLINDSQSNFAANFPSASGFAQLDDSFISQNGDDAFRILDSSNNSVDAFGVENEDASGHPWEYTNSYAKRNPMAPASPVFDVSQWTFGGPNALNGQCGSLETAMGGIQAYFQDAGGSPYFTEDFENAGAFPSGWTLTNGTDDWDIDQGDDHGPGTAQEGTYCAFFNDYDYSSGTTADMVTPTIDLSGATNPRLRFSYWDGQGTSGNNSDTVEILISLDGTSYSTIFTTPSTVAPWTEFTADLAAYAGQSSVQIAFRGTSIWGYTNPHVDNIFVEEAPPCPQPTSVTVDAQGSNTLDVSWTAGGSETEWKIAWGVEGFTPDFTASTNVAAVSTTPTYQITGLTESTNYDIYVMSDCGNGHLSEITGPVSTHTTPGNNECGNAINLPIYNFGQSVGHELAQSTQFATASQYSLTSCDTYATNLDLFYTFLLPPGQTKVRVLTSGTKGSKIEAALYDSCGGTEIVCLGQSSEKVISGLTGGQQYTLQVWHDSYNAGEFKIALELPPMPPSNDVCSGAWNLAVYPYGASAGNETTGHTGYATESGTVPSCDSNATYDLFYKFVVPANETDVVIYTTGDTGDDLTISVTDACGGNEIVCETGDSRHIVRGLTSGYTYYIQAAHVSTDAGLFKIAVEIATDPPANDDCANATVINSLPYINTMDATFATGGVLQGGCSNGMNDGVWYTFTGDGGNITIVADPDGWDNEIGVYSGTCGSLVCEGRADSHGAGTAETVTFQSVAGTQYLVNIGHYTKWSDKPEGPFTITISTDLVGISDNVIDEFTYFPNPVNNVLNLNAQNDITNVAVYDISGKEVMNLSPNAMETQVDMSRLHSGIYFVKVAINDQVTAIKVIKE